ncbi:M50 family metallopeptidase [Pontibacillus litoralis]|uniref:Stage IV sporulation protein FB n=1 Tax=Pontibacillus litoralis JSM 072002 TaxID=1385512 RepID=A0A0A5GD42_9BACI|nr:M50 family metallopeptidase [Pontibacillus litoralis]KGX89010.1 stage IV sporulation protein FB [Pontibacillus litoralis JSM 072002]
MNISKKINHFHIHPILWAMIAIGIVTGSFLQLIAIFLIVLIHELGHYGMALYYRWRIRSVMLWPFGGVMETDEHHTRPLKEELAVSLAGPVQHLWLYGVIWMLGWMQWVSPSMVDLLFLYNTSILIFNLLPVWPLDGGHLLFLFLSHRFPFVKAQAYVIICSIVCIAFTVLISLLIFPFSLTIVLLACFLLWENRLEWKQRQYTFLRYLLKRHEDRNDSVHTLHAIHVPEDMPIHHIFHRFKRGTHHHIYVLFRNQSRKVIDEGECLYYYFTLKQSSASAKDVAEWSAM